MFRYKLVNTVLPLIGIFWTFLLLSPKRSVVNNLLCETSKKLLFNNSTQQHQTPKEIDYDNLSMEDIMRYFFETNSSSCRQSVDFGFSLMESDTMGMAPDGFKAVCMDPGVRPAYNNCLVYSFGIRDEWSFDEAMEKYGCQVFSFDPSMEIGDHQHSERVWFYNLGLGGENVDKGPSSEWKMRTLSSIYDTLQDKHGPEKIIDYLKVDIEFSEWDTLQQIYASGMLGKVKQIGMEVHLHAQSSLSTLRKCYELIKSLENDHGFYRFVSRPSVWAREYFKAWDRMGNYAFEMAWYNSRYVNATFLNDPYTFW